MSVASVVAARRLQVAAILVATVAGFAVEGPSTAAIAAVVGFFAAKSVESLKLALA